MTARTWMDRTFYPDYEDGWDHKRFRALIQRYLRPDLTILDFGCGRGGLEEMNFRGQVAMVAGVDPGESVLENPHLDEAKVLSLDDETIPFPDATFDLVFSSNVLEHLPRPLRSLSEIQRVLKPRGHFLAKTPNRFHYVPLAASLTPHAFHVFYNRLRGVEERDTFPTLYRCNSRRRLGSMARRAGFSIVDLGTWEGRPEYLRIAAPTYLLGLFYERIVNSSDALAGLRSVIVAVLQKPS